MMAQTPAWVTRLRGMIEANKPQPFFFTLCTLGLDGTPRARTVASRQVVGDETQKGKLVICTDTTSEKWAELSKNPNFEICCYFATSREQLRLRGSDVQFFRRPSPEAEEVWHGMSETAKATFMNASTKQVENFGVLTFRPHTAQLLETMTGAITSWDRL
jgi:hypothetical protein